MGEAAVEAVLDVKEALCELEELHVALGEGLERLRAVAFRAGRGAGECARDSELMVVGLARRSVLIHNYY